jgi:anti-sigma regulatory factor (Ser/Thr protein kinase)
MSAERWLSPVPESVPESRRFVAESLSGMDHAGVRQVALMVSEIATNCVVHARTAFRIAITRHENQVRVEVTDRSPQRAVRQAVGPDTPHGRGLFIVSELADDWGVVPAPDGRHKTVWFALALDPTTVR